MYSNDLSFGSLSSVQRTRRSNISESLHEMCLQGGDGMTSRGVVKQTGLAIQFLTFSRLVAANPSHGDIYLFLYYSDEKLTNLPCCRSVTLSDCQKRLSEQKCLCPVTWCTSMKTQRSQQARSEEPPRDVTNDERMHTVT